MAVNARYPEKHGAICRIYDTRKDANGGRSEAIFFFRFDYNFNPMPDTSPILFKLYLPIFRDSSIFVPNGPLFFRVVSIQNFSTPRWTVEEKARALWRIPGSSYFSIIRNLYGGIGLTVEIDTAVSVHVHFLDHILDWNTERKAAYVLCLVAPFENYRRGREGKSSEQDVNEYIRFSIFFFFRRKKEIVILLCFLTSLRN